MSFVSDNKSSPASEDDTYMDRESCSERVDVFQPSSEGSASSSVPLVEAYICDPTPESLDAVNAAAGISNSLSVSLVEAYALVGMEDASDTCPAGSENSASDRTKSSSLVVAYATLGIADDSDSASDTCPAGSTNSSSLEII